MFSPGSVHKLSNHQTEFGVTDAVKVFENLLLCSGYDLDNGVGYVNGNFYICVDLSCGFTDVILDCRRM